MLVGGVGAPPAVFGVFRRPRKKRKIFEKAQERRRKTKKAQEGRRKILTAKKGAGHAQEYLKRRKKGAGKGARKN